MVRKISLMLCAILTAWVSFVCLRIEVYNVEAGGYLPRRPVRGGYVTKWRCASPEVIWSMMETKFWTEGEPQEDGSYRVRPLTHDEKSQVLEMMERASLLSSFHDFIVRFGLWQYLLAPLALVWAVILACLRRQKAHPDDTPHTTPRRLPNGYRATAICLAVLSAASMVLMFYRGYGPSLGW